MPPACHTQPASLVECNPQIGELHEEEWSYIPVGGPLPLPDQPAAAFGAAASLVHPGAWEGCNGAVWLCGADAAACGCCELKRQVAGACLSPPTLCSPNCPIALQPRVTASRAACGRRPPWRVRCGWRWMSSLRQQQPCALCGRRCGRRSGGARWVIGHAAVRAVSGLQCAVCRGCCQCWTEVLARY